MLSDWQKFCLLELAPIEHAKDLDTILIGGCVKSVTYVMFPHIMLIIMALCGYAFFSKSSLRMHSEHQHRHFVSSFLTLLLNTLSVCICIFSVCFLAYWHYSYTFWQVHCITISVVFLYWFLYLNFNINEFFGKNKFTIYFILFILISFSLVSAHIFLVVMRMRFYSRTEYSGFLISSLSYYVLLALALFLQALKYICEYLSNPPNECSSILCNDLHCSPSYHTFSSQRECHFRSGQFTVISFLMFSWLNPLLKSAQNSGISSEKALTIFPEFMRSNFVFNKFIAKQSPSHVIRNSAETFIKKNEQRVSFSYKVNPKQSTHAVLDELFRYNTIPFIKFNPIKSFIEMYGFWFFSVGLLKLFSDILSFSNPILLALLIKNLTTENQDSAQSSALLAYTVPALTMICVNFVNTFLSVHFDYQLNNVGLCVRSAILSLLHHVELRSKMANLMTFSSGEISTFIGVDAERIVSFCTGFHFIWSFPLQITVSFYLLYLQIGVFFIPGLLFCVLLVAFNKCIANKINTYSKSLMRNKDARIKLLLQVFSGVRAIKMMAWESFFIEKIRRLRGKEVLALKGQKYLDAICVFLWTCTPLVLSFLTIGLYLLVGKNLPPHQLFSCLALIKILVTPLNALPWILNGMIESYVSYGRIQHFLEIALTKCEKNSTCHVLFDLFEKSRNTLTEEEEDTDKQKEDIDFFVEKGIFDYYQIMNKTFNSYVEFTLKLSNKEFIGLTGPTASGKSSVLLAILGELHCLSSDKYLPISLRRKIGYVSEESWIFKGSVRDNIVYKSKFDESFYHKVIMLCCLQKDLDEMSSSDLTQVGTNGFSLSGGQKVRIALARALYSKADIFIFDEIFSALDKVVAKSIMMNVLLLFLHDKTRIVVSSDEDVFHFCHSVYYLEKNKIVNSHQNNIMNVRDTQRQSKCNLETDDVEQLNHFQTTKDVSNYLECTEKKEIGKVSHRIYALYIKSMGVYLFISIIIFLSLSYFSKIFIDIWLAVWSFFQSTKSVIEKKTFLNVGNFIGVYLLLSLTNSITVVFRAFLFAYSGIKASTRIHTQLFSSVVSTPLTFFLKTPIGRIINRFNSDVYTLDDSLPFILNILLSSVADCFATILMLLFSQPFLMFLLLPLTSVYLHIQNFYRQSSRELKRLYSISLSPIYENFSEIAKGKVYISAFRYNQLYFTEALGLIDKNIKISFTSKTLACWLSLRLQLIASITTSSLILLSIFQKHWMKAASMNAFDSIYFGLALAYALNFSNQLNSFISAFTETEKEFVSVERLNEYMNLPASDQSINEEEESKVDQCDWPSLNSYIYFKNVNLTYHDGNHALKAVNFSIKLGQKVAIIGRTGSGKSSIFAVLTRLYDISENVAGEGIFIDGIDVSKVSLNKLRKCIFVLPQDPFIFEGTIKCNVDPMNLYSCDHIIDFVTKAGLHPQLVSVGGLEHVLEEGGKNISFGQKQIICLLRAFLSECPIICVDEGTSNVDTIQRENFISALLGRGFLQKTIFLILHRYHSLDLFDTVIEMADGCVKSITYN